jgi:hypothetical protein
MAGHVTGHHLIGLHVCRRSAGSTGGGMKCLRIMLCFKYLLQEFFAMVHPRAVTTIKIGGKTVPEDVVRSILGFPGALHGTFRPIQRSCWPAPGLIF